MNEEVKAKRDEAIQIIEAIKHAVDDALQYQGLKDADRKRLNMTPDDIFCAFEELVERFIEPQAATSPALASYGYSLLLILMANTFSAGGCLMDTGLKELEFLKKMKAQADGKLGGKNSGKSRASKWQTPAKEELRKIRAEGRGGSTPDIGKEIHGRLKLADVKGTPKDADTVIRWVRKQ
jgi:hypothetical protein